MTAKAKTNTEAKVHEHESVAQGSAQVGIGILTVASALIGTWGVACLIGGLSKYGVVGMIKGWLSAVMGG